MLLLVLAHRDQVGVVQEDVRRHEHGVDVRLDHEEEVEGAESHHNERHQDSRGQEGDDRGTSPEPGLLQHLLRGTVLELTRKMKAADDRRIDPPRLAGEQRMLRFLRRPAQAVRRIPP